MTRLLPAAQGHTLEPWAAYWELRVRLDEAQPAEITGFLQRFAGCIYSLAEAGWSRLAAPGTTLSLAL